MTERPAIAQRYETLRRLAVGGMGEIFLARERGRLGFSRLVVLKRMLPELARKPDYVDMFVDEARIVGHLSHPNICQILEFGDEDGVPFLVLEYVRGDSLSGIWDRAIRTGVTVPRAVTLRLLADTAWALHHAHEACDVDGAPLAVIHRDISPHNVMVSFHGDVKLMDFGIARAENRVHRTDTGKVKGKVAYMAPEQLRGRPLDRRADVFSVGVMLWELTLSRRLFGGSGQVETLQKAVQGHVPTPRSIDPDYPDALEAIVMRALAADPDERTATAGELASALIEQVTALGGAERSDVAALMRTLFPDEIDAPEDTIPTRSWIDDDIDLFEETNVRTPAAPAVAPAAVHSVKTVTLRPTVPLRAPTQPAPVAVVPVPAAALASAEPPRRRRVLVIAATATVVLGAALAIGLTTSSTATNTPTNTPTTQTATPPTTTPTTQTATQPTTTPTTEPSSPTTNETSSTTGDSGGSPRDPTAGGSGAKPRNPPTTPATATSPGHGHVATSTRPTTSPTSAGTGTRPTTGTPGTTPPTTKAVDVVAATAALGTLAVSSDRTGVVVIDGVRRKSTPFQTELPAGDHQIALELTEGAGTLRATAHVTAGKKTKCKVDNATLACSSPPSR